MKRPIFERPRLPARQTASDTKIVAPSRRFSVDGIIKKYSRPMSRVIGLSDATGSMQALWLATRQHIQEMIRRAAELGPFRMRWVAYRDYCDGPNILEASGWHEQSAPLLRFVESIRCYGGGDEPEAVERVLHFAANDPDATRVILIGDAPPHANRDYREQAARLAQLKRPVFSFVVGGDKRTIKTFKEISKITGGISASLDDLNDLLDDVVLTVADEMGGGEMVQAYLKKYRKQLSAGGQSYGRLLLKGGC